LLPERVEASLALANALGDADRYDECIRLLDLLDVESPALRQTLSKQQAQSVAATLRRRLLEAPPFVQRRYVRGLVSEIVVDKETAVISGPPAAIAAAVTSGALNGEVRGLEREWRTRQDETANWFLTVARPSCLRPRPSSQ
jgi:hypothetical protein